MRSAIPLLAGVLLTFGCATPRPVPPPRAAYVAPPAPYVPPAPLPPTNDWRDWALTPGDWRYAAAAGGSVSSYGSGATARLSLQCIAGAHAMLVTIDAAPAGAATVRTSSMTQAITLALSADGAASATLRLSATDPLLDAMAFSRGRFVIEAPGRPPLVVPVYAEIGRVIEDCRG